MKILHLGDLHLGKKVCNYPMLESQKFVLEQAIKLIETEKIVSVLITGDVFDKTIPPAYALELFNDFLNELNSLKVKVYIIPGNHDNSDRLAFLSTLLKKSNVYISKPFSFEVEMIEDIQNIRFYLLPYVYPSLVRKLYKDEKIVTYNDALKRVVDGIKLDQDKINVILAHQFVVSAKNDTILSQSEQKNVGTIDEVNFEIFEKFDYCALGHLHCSQKVGNEKVRYCGSILKYSQSEIKQKKVFNIIDIKSKNDIEIKLKEIAFLHDVVEYRGYIDEFLDEKFYSKIDKDDFIYFTLLDECVIDAKKKLSMIYPNILSLEFDNSFTKKLNMNFNANFSKEKDIFEHFCDFYSLQCSSSLDDIQKNIVKNILASMEDEKCSH